MSRSALLAAARRGFPIAAALFALAACSDSPSAPTAAAAPDARVSADLIGGGIIVRDPGVTVRLHLLDQGLGEVPGTTMEFKTNAGFTKTVVDNAAGDADVRVGYYSVQMPNALSYTATAKVLPADISFAGASKTVSYFNSPTLVDMGTLYLNIKPGFFITMYYQGAIVTGQTLKISKGPDFAVTITDGGPSDKDQFGNQSPADGKIHVRVPVTGNYQICAMSTPAWGWGGCTEGWALQYFMAYAVNFTYQQQWVIPKLP
jgi:hypothetical protein